MSRIIVVILFALCFLRVGSAQEQGSESEPTEVNDKSESDEDKYETESRQDFDKTSEKEKELKILRKAKRLKESNYRRALESILPAKNSEGYRRFFEDLINNSDEKSRADAPQKEVEEVVVTDTFVDGEPSDGNTDFDPQVEEIEVVIEHITDDIDNTTETTPADIETSTESQNLSTEDATDSPKVDLREKDSNEDAAESKNQEAPQNNNSSPTDNVVVNTKGRMGIDTSRSAEMDSMHFGRLEERRLLEPFPLSRISEVVIPHYRTTLTRNGVVVSPAVYTVQTSSPIIDHVTSRSWMPSRGLGADIFGRSTTNKIGRSDADTRLIDDYNDYGSNAYSYSPTKLHLSSRQGESKMDILSKLAEASLQPPLGNLKPYRENMYPGAYYPQHQRFFPDSYRPLFRIRR